MTATATDPVIPAPYGVELFPFECSCGVLSERSKLLATMLPST